MFQRQARQPFPARYIVILAAAVLALLFFLLKNLNKEEKTNPPPTEQTDGEMGDNGLRPAEARQQDILAAK